MINWQKKNRNTELLYENLHQIIRSLHESVTLGTRENELDGLNQLDGLKELDGFNQLDRLNA